MPIHPAHRIDIPVRFTAPATTGPARFSVEYMSLPRELPMPPLPVPPGLLDPHRPITEFTTPLVTKVFEDNGFPLDNPSLDDWLLEAVKNALAPGIEWSLSFQVYDEQTRTIIKNESSLGFDFPDPTQNIKPPEIESSFEVKIEREKEDKKQKEAQVVNSATPEDKYGPTGFDVPGTPAEEHKRFVPADRDLYYKVDFWNKEDATAPACDVFVKDQLDPNLDERSFRFEEIGFHKWTVKLEPCQYFNVNVDMRPDVNLVVNVEGKFDQSKRELTWIFKSLDPATWQMPEDPMAGFLPPITTSGEEVGWVTFSVKAKDGLGTGAKIRNQAFVEFDWSGDILNHPAPEEGPWLNTIDAGTPESYVLPLVDTMASCTFTVQWTGQDDPCGSGIASYDIYVSTDSGSYKLWLDDTNQTSASFTADCNNSHTYAFYSVARDNVGHVESPPPKADATTMVTPIRVGDVTGDGKVTAYDAALAAQCAEGSINLSAMI